MSKILVIEDEDTIRENIVELLELEHYETLVAENGKTGLKLALQEIPDLILCDILMPEMDGYAVLKELKNHANTATIPFIFLTAKVDKSDLREGMDLRADDYLTKPCTPTELLKAIAARLEKKAFVEKKYQESLNELRSNITLSLPHELRTPLNVILGFSNLLLNESDSISTEQSRQMLKYIRQASERLYRLIQNFLLYAELEIVASDAQRLHALQSVTLSGTQALISDIATQKALQVHRLGDLHLEVQEFSVKIAAPRLKTMVEELVDNALKFSSPGTPVYLTTRQENQTFTLLVSNQGRGMSAQQIAQIGAYMQFERKLYEQQGSGLGLILTKRLAEVHGGELTIESIPGETTTVKVMLPMISRSHDSP